MNQGPYGGYQQQGYPQAPPPKKGMGGGMGALIVFGCLFGGCFTCVAIGAASRKSAESAQGSVVPGATIAAPKAAAPRPPPAEETLEDVSVATLMKDYEANEVRGDNKWKGHHVAVTGVVGDVKKNAFGGIYVTLGTGAQYEMKTVHCHFAKAHADEAASMSKGDKVTIKGKVTGMIMMSVMVGDAELVR